VRKQVVTVLVLSWSLLAFAQTFEEEMQQEKIMFRQYQTAQHSQTSFAEQRQLRREYRAFITAQRQADVAVTEADEIKQLKRDYRSFLTEQNRQRVVASNNTQRR